MSNNNIHYIQNDENITNLNQFKKKPLTNSENSNSQFKKQSLKTNPQSQQPNQQRILKKGLQELANNSNNNSNNNNNNNGGNIRKKKSLKRTGSLLLDDQDLKKKILVQKDETKIIHENYQMTSPLKRKKISHKNFETEKKSLFNEDEIDYNNDVETVYDKPSPIEYIPDDFPVLTEQDIKFFTTKRPIPEKSINFYNNNNKIQEEFLKRIPEVEISLELSDNEIQEMDYFDTESNKENVNEEDLLIKKQFKPLESCNVKLMNQKIPKLQFEDYI